MKRLFSIAAAAALALAGCSSADSNSADSKTSSADGKLSVMASFYPLQFVAEQVGGEHVAVSSMTPTGGEAHDLELAPKTVAEMEQTDVVVYLEGFQPSVDAAVKEAKPKHVYDAKDDARLIPVGAESDPHAHDHGHDHDGEEGHDHDHDGEEGHDHDHDGEEGHDHDHDGEEGHDHDHDGEEGHDHDHDGEEGHDHDHDGEEGHDHDHDAEEGHDHDGHHHHHHDMGGMDPHFWLDTIRVKDVAEAMAETFAVADPAHADDYRANAKALGEKLVQSHKDYHKGLEQCEKDTIVVSHEAYGYITSHFGLKQVGLSGVDPEAEPAPATLAKVKEVMDKYNVTTIFTENLIDSKAAEAFAAETGAKTAVLDPIENLADPQKDYLVLMDENLQALRDALQCK